MNDNTAVKSKKRIQMALIRAVCALVLAAILLALTGFSVFTLIKGPNESESVQDDAIGDFVYRDIYAIMGFYADEVTSGDKVQARYGLVPMGGELVTVRFTSRYLESANAVCDSTYSFINGQNAGTDSYIVVQGTVGTLSEETSALMYDWFGLNREQLVQMGMIEDTDDYADHLSDYVLIVDTVKGYNQTLVIVLSSIAAALLLYMIAELCLIGTGFYKKKEKALLEDAEVATTVETEASEEEKEEEESEAPKSSDESEQIEDEKEPAKAESSDSEQAKEYSAKTEDSDAEQTDKKAKDNPESTEDSE